MTRTSLADVSVAILSYNRRDELLATLSVVCRPDLDWREVIVADNGSTDGTCDAVRATYPSVRLLAFEDNVGIEASNRAYQAATAPWVLSLDDDSAPAVETFGEVAAVLAASPRTAAAALSVRRSAAGATATSTSEPSAYLGPTSRSGVTFTSAPAYGFSSAGVLFNRAALDVIGAYDPELFLFTNELHWTARALLAGWELTTLTRAVVVHRSSPRNRQSATHAFYYCRNLLLFLLRYAPVAEKRALVADYLRDVLAYSALHRTGVYLRACRSAWDLAGRTPSKVQPLSADLFRTINPDLRVAYGYLR